jgi:hypothetical protein
MPYQRIKSARPDAEWLSWQPTTLIPPSIAELLTDTWIGSIIVVYSDGSQTEWSKETHE